MKKRIIVTEEQLKNYIEKKKAEKTFNSILNEMHKNSKNLKDGISLNKANQTIIENYKDRNQLNPRVQNLLKEYNIVDDMGEII